MNAFRVVLAVLAMFGGVRSDAVTATGHQLGVALVDEVAVRQLPSCDIRIPAASICRTITETGDQSQVQPLLDACHTVRYNPYGWVMLTLAHRTSCGANGFDGVQHLGPGDTATQYGLEYVYAGRATGPIGEKMVTYLHPHIGLRFDGLLLQTSLTGSTVVWVWMVAA